MVVKAVKTLFRPAGLRPEASFRPLGFRVGVPGETLALGCMSLAEINFCKTLAASSKFKQWASVLTYDQALSKIHHNALPAPANGNQYTVTEQELYRPYALVWTADDGGGFTREQDAVSNGFDFIESGRLVLQLSQDVPAEITDHHAEVDKRFKNDIGQIIDDLCDMAGSGPYTAFTRLTVVDGPGRVRDDDAPTKGEMQHVKIEFEWGPR